jgi:TrkA domain protein
VTEIRETELPGIGVRQEFDTVTGTRLGVLTTRTGRKELLIYDREDPDSCRATVHLDPEDGVVLADLLGSSRRLRLDRGAERLTDDATGLVRIGHRQGRPERRHALAVRLDQRHVDTVDRGAAHQAKGPQER